MGNTPPSPAGLAAAAAVSAVHGCVFVCVCVCVCVRSTVGWSPAECVRCTALYQLFIALHTVRTNRLVESLQIRPHQHQPDSGSLFLLFRTDDTLHVVLYFKCATNDYFHFTFTLLIYLLIDL